MATANITAQATKFHFGPNQLPGFIIGGKAKAAVLVVQEWWGVTDSIKRQAQYIHEKTGFQVLIPDLYKGKVSVEAEEASHQMDHLDFMGAAGEIKEAAEYLKDKEGAQKVGVVGFCMGGALGLLGSITGAPLDAVVAFYGRPEGGDPSKIKIPVQGHTGTEDAFKGFADPATMKEFFDGVKSPGTAELFVYEGQNHGFMNAGDDITQLMSTGKLPAGGKDAQDLAWDRTLSFLKKTL